MWVALPQGLYSAVCYRIYGFSFPKYRGGPMFYASQIGLQKVYQRICHYHQTCRKYGASWVGVGVDSYCHRARHDQCHCHEYSVIGVWCLVLVCSVAYSMCNFSSVCQKLGQIQQFTYFIISNNSICTCIRNPRPSKSIPL